MELDEETVSASRGQLGIGAGHLRWLLVCLFDVVNGPAVSSLRRVFNEERIDRS